MIRPGEPRTEEAPPNDRLSGPRIVMRAIDHRAQLAVCEVAEVWSQLVRFAVGGMIGLGLLHLTLIAGLVALVAATWETPWRVAAPLLATVLFGAGGFGLLWYVRRRHHAWEPFRDLLQQLAGDVRSLHELLNAFRRNGRSAAAPEAATDPARDRTSEEDS